MLYCVCDAFCYRKKTEGLPRSGPGALIGQTRNGHWKGPGGEADLGVGEGGLKGGWGDALSHARSNTPSTNIGRILDAESLATCERQKTNVSPQLMPRATVTVCVFAKLPVI